MFLAKIWERVRELQEERQAQKATTTEEVQSYGNFTVGDEVCIVEDSGFQAGISQRKKIARIVAVCNTPEEASRMREGRAYPLFIFTDGSTAGYFTSVRKVRK